MRLLLDVDDNLSSDLKMRITAIADKLNAHPEFADEILLEDDIEVMFTPERLAQIDRALADVKAGNFFTAAQVEEHFAQKEALWTQAHRQ